MPGEHWELVARPPLPAADWEHYLKARGLVARGQLPAAKQEFETLHDRLAAADRPWLWMRWADALDDAGQYEEARQARAEGIQEAAGPARAQLVAEQGRALRRMGLFSEAEKLLLAALEWRRSQPDGQLGVAWLQYQMANLYRVQEEIDSADTALRGALEIARAHAPASSLEGAILNSLGNVALLRRDLAAADRAYREAASLAERQGAPDPAPLVNLASLAQARGDFSRAEALLERAAELSRDRGGVKRTAILVHLASLRLERGDLAGAEPLFADCLKLREQTALRVCESGLGRVALGRGDVDRAEQLFARTLDRRRQAQPGSPGEAEALEQLGEVALARGDIDAAAARLATAVALRRRTAPASADLARSLGLLARAEHRRGRIEEALSVLSEAAGAAEAQQSRLGGGELAPISYHARVAWIYADWVDLLVELGRVEDAFQAAERSRAQSLRALLAEQGRDLAPAAPPAETRERRQLWASIDRAYSELAAVSSSEEAEQRRARLRLEQLLDRWEALEQRSGAGREMAADAEVRSVAAVGDALTPGTLLLSYSLGGESGVVFALPSGGDVSAHAIGASRDELAALVRDFRREMPRVSRRARPAPGDSAARLSELLLGPVADSLSRAQRLIVLPDGPLHRLPFAALADPVPGSDGVLIERVSVQAVASAGLLVELRRRPRPVSRRRLVAFANPRPSAEAEATLGVDRLPPLPWTEVEAAETAKRFPGARVFTGSAASETAFRAEAPKADLLHLGCHGLVDERLPLSSTLVLAATAEASGLLHAWEVIQDLRLKADLVTLSACDTALGENAEGAGLVGLTWALQRAGARGVLASLWPVEDEPTALLMQRFYGYLAQGREKPEALRAAQLDFLRGPVSASRNGDGRLLDLRHPRHWAGFVLIGD